MLPRNRPARSSSAPWLLCAETDREAPRPLSSPGRAGSRRGSQGDRAPIGWLAVRLRRSRRRRRAGSADARARSPRFMPGGPTLSQSWPLVSGRGPSFAGPADSRRFKEGTCPKWWISVDSRRCPHLNAFLRSAVRIPREQVAEFAGMHTRGARASPGHLQVLVVAATRGTELVMGHVRPPRSAAASRGLALSAAGSCGLAHSAAGSPATALTAAFLRTCVW